MLTAVAFKRFGGKAVSSEEKKLIPLALVQIGGVPNQLGAMYLVDYLSHDIQCTLME